MPNDPGSDSPARSAESTKLLLEQLSSEYKILQDKIDKIGAFKFTIRGWSVTIVIASCIGATTARLPSPFLLCGLIVFVVVFGVMEYVQARHRRIFGRRCAEIERRIWRLLREQGIHVAGMVPKIAHELADQTRADLRRWPKRMRRPVRAVVSHGEVVFCVVLIAVIVALAFWLDRHPRAPERAETPRVIQVNVTNPERSLSVPVSNKAEGRKDIEPNASKKTNLKKR
jgi:hypothetical protein